MDDNQLRDQLDLAADGIEVGDAMVALGGVHSSARRRRRRRFSVAAVGATLLLVGGVATVVTLNGSEGDEVIRSATPSTSAPATSLALAPSATEASTSDGSAEIPPAADGSEAAEAVDGQPVSLPSFDAVDGSGYVEWLVPWNDGFLAGGNVYRPQPLPSELPPEVVELFPPEVVELFADGLPATIDEATAMLSEAGLLDEVTTVISEHPEANEAIFATPVIPAQAVVQFTVDGEEWSSVDVQLPDGVSGLHRVSVAGDRLVIVDGPQTEDSASIIVASTTDLSTWETQTIDLVRPVDLPDAVRFSAWPSSLAANESGWVVGVNISSFVDFEQFLPSEVRDAMSNSGGGVSTGGDGIQIDIEPAAGGERESYTYTWAELDVPEEIIPYLEGAPGTAEIWAAPFGGTPMKSDLDRMFATNIAATPDRFLLSGQEFLASTDGLTWTDIEGSADAGYVAAVTPTDGGIVAFTSGAAGEGGALLFDSTLTSWTSVDIPGAPERMGSVLNHNAGAPAIIVDASPPQYTEWTISFEAEGFRMIQSSAGSVQSYELVDIATGTVVLSETVDLQDLDGNSYSDTGPFAHLTYSTDQTGVTIVDPASGDVLVVIPQDVVNQAYDEAFSQMDDEMPEFRPDQWLIAYKGFNEWLVDDLPDAAEGVEGSFAPSATAINGDTLLVGVNGGWLRYDLGS